MPDGIRGATRLYSETQAIPAGGRLAAEPAKSKTPDSYLSTIIKLIPSEIVAGYVAIASTWQEKGGAFWLSIWFWLCLVACLILRAYASLPKDKPPAVANVQWVSVAISCIAFFLWASAVYPDTKGSSGLAILSAHPNLAIPPWAAGGIALLFGTLAAIFVPKDDQKP
jgi:hypothetical protein